MTVLERLLDGVGVREAMADDIRTMALTAINAKPDVVSDKYPKTEFKVVPVNKRAGDNIKGEKVLGWVRTGKMQTALLVPSKFDYKEWGKSLKADELLARLETPLTKVVGNSYDNATIVKMNLKTKTMTLPTQDALDGITTFEWDKPVRVKDLIIFLPFKETI